MPPLQVVRAVCASLEKQPDTAIFKASGGSVKETDRQLVQPLRYFMKQLGAEFRKECLGNSISVAQPRVGRCGRHAVCRAELAVIPRRQGALWTVTMCAVLCCACHSATATSRCRQPMKVLLCICDFDLMPEAAREGVNRIVALNTWVSRPRSSGSAQSAAPASLCCCTTPHCASGVHAAILARAPAAPPGVPVSQSAWTRWRADQQPVDGEADAPARHPRHPRHPRPGRAA